MKKLLSAMFMLLILSFMPLIANAAESGTCGADEGNLTWTLDDDGTLTISGEGAMKDYNGDISPWYSRADIKKLVINNGVTSIGDYAFYICESLTSVTIPDSVTSIGEWAFSGCSKVTEVTIPDNITSIGINAFFGTAYYRNENNWEGGVLYIGNYLIVAKDLPVNSEYSIKENTKVIADGAFAYRSNLTKIIIPQGVKSIGDHAFYYCTGLTYISIPASVTDIHTNSFESCDKLANIEVATDNDVFLSDDNVLINKDIGMLIFYPSSKSGGYSIPQGIKQICDNAFSNCENLTSIDIPQSVTTISCC